MTYASLKIEVFILAEERQILSYPFYIKQIHFFYMSLRSRSDRKELQDLYVKKIKYIFLSFCLKNIYIELF